MTLRETLAQAGLRPTRQRLLLSEQLFDGCNKHVTAEALHRNIMMSGEQSVSLATVYNTLAAFNKAGLLRTVTLDSGRVYYDTNIELHHHLYDVTTKELTDVMSADINVTGLPRIPDGKTLESVDVIMRIK